MAVEAQSPAPAAPPRPRPKREREGGALARPDLVLLALTFAASPPYIARSRHMQGVWFGTKYSARIAVITAIYAFIVSFGLVVIDAGDTTGTERFTRWIPPCPGGPATESKGEGG